MSISGDFYLAMDNVRVKASGVLQGEIDAPGAHWRVGMRTVTDEH